MGGVRASGRRQRGVWVPRVWAGVARLFGCESISAVSAREPALRLVSAAPCVCAAGKAGGHKEISRGMLSGPGAETDLAM
jgi:hypothetical protein